MASSKSMEKHISVWIDKTGEPGSPALVVSIDDDDDTEALRIFDVNERYEAIEFAAIEALRRGLSLSLFIVK